MNDSPTARRPNLITHAAACDAANALAARQPRVRRQHYMSVIFGHMNSTKESENIVEQYNRDVALYKAFTEKVGALVVEILEGHKINYHSVTRRLKARDSLTKKLARPDTEEALHKRQL
jgi:ppGpp synthetase/RelA/SpoT-type nucleotidyltranferase